jgi:uncharacterized protein involved in outer membrane biogenesis
MKSPLAAWRAGTRWPLATLGVVVALVAAVLVCEALGWPFLVSPVQRWLASTIDRRVEFNDASGGQSGVRVGLLGGVRVDAQRIEIGAPAWSKAPYTLLAQDARLRLGYLDLWRAWRGEPLRIQRLEARELDGTLERMADGRASWQFGRKPAAEAEAGRVPLPSFARLRVGKGHLNYTDEMLPASVEAYFALSDGTGPAAAGVAASGASDPGGIFVRAGGAAKSASAAAAAVELAPGERGLRLNAFGHYRKLPVRVELRTSGVLGLLEEGSEATAQPLRLIASVGQAHLTFDGTTTDPLHFAGLKGRFTVSGASLASIGDPLGITLPTTPPFKTRGTLVKDGGLWKAVFDDATIGSSRLAGAFTYESRLRKVPLLSGRITGSRLVLADLGPAVGAEGAGDDPPAKAKPASSERVIPDRKFDLPSLRAMDANVLIDIAMFDPGTTVIEPLRPVHAHLLLADGVLTIADFQGRTAQGRLAGFLQLDGRGKQALWTADMRALGVDLGHWLRIKRSDPQSPSYLSGKLDALVQVKGAGRSTAEILGSLNGDIRAHVRQGSVSHLVIEMLGLDVAQALGIKLVKGDKSLPLLCNVIDLDVAGGVARPKAFVFDTTDSAVFVDGTLSLKTEAIDVRAVVSPKDFSPLTLRTPIRVQGTLGDPQVSIEAGKLVGKAGAAAVLGALVAPLAAIVPFVDPGAREEAKETAARCAALVDTSGRMSGATKVPKNVRVPPASGPAAAAASAAR